MRCRPDTAPAPDPFPAAGGPLLTAEQERALATSIREADRAAAELADIVEGDPDRFTRLLGPADEGPVSPAEFADALRRYKAARCKHATATGLGDGEGAEGLACLLHTVRAGLGRLDAGGSLAPPERALLEAIERGRQSRNHLTERNLGLVIDIAVRHTRRLARMIPVEDRIGEGTAGLLRAVESYDPERGARFSTYAFNWVRQSIRKAVEAQGAPIRVPEHGARLLRRFNARKEEMGLRSGGPLPDDQVVRDMRLPPGEEEALLRAMDAAGRMPWTGRGHSAAPEDVPQDDDRFACEGAPVADRLIFQEDWRRVEALLDDLPPLERQVLVQRFGLEGAEPRTLKEIGKVLRLTREGVRVVESRAIRRLRGKLAGSGRAGRALGREVAPRPLFGP